MGALVTVMVSPHLADGCAVAKDATAALVADGWKPPQYSGCMSTDNSFRTRIQELTVSDGTKVAIPPNGVVLFVGPNNSGKSQSLKDLLNLNDDRSYQGKALTDLALDKSGSKDDFVQWVLTHLPPAPDNNGNTQQMRTIGRFGSMPEDFIASRWSEYRWASMAEVFIYYAGATTRLQAGNSVKSIDFTKEAASQPLQRAYIDSTLEDDLRETCLAAFGVPVSVNRYGGGLISLRIGTPPEFEHHNGVPSPRYLQQMNELPLLEEQGDGMKSYIGLLLHILAGAHQITLVDEPEAFLHPPQARLLAQTLSRRTASQQLFMATHSNDIVQGVLEGQAPVTIVRLTRRGTVNNAAVLEAEQVQKLWSDPLLRYSNLLDGLFHDAIVLCEGDADCRYYSSVIDSLYEHEELTDLGRRPQLQFSHCGGKARLSSVVSSLRAISIPVVIVADFDILNDEALLEKTVKSLGGDFAAMRSDWRILNAGLRSSTRPLSKRDLKSAIDRTFEDIPGETISKADARKIKSVVRVDSGWDSVKRSGLGGVPGGNVSESAIRLVNALQDLGILVVPVGELERFEPTVTNHGPQWVTEVHKQGLHDNQERTQPRDFAKKIVKAATRKASL